ncbi:hypothetical protein ACWDR9_39225, partial [Streptosporangium sandarakinum]
AARLADADAAAVALRHAAAVAGCRGLGDDMFRLHRAAAEAARRAGDATGAGRDLATAATVAYRFSSLFTRVPSAEEAAALLAEAREPAGDAPAAEAAIALAEAAVVADAFGAVQGDTDNTARETVGFAERAVELARRAGDPVAESAALDALSGAWSWAGEPFAAAAAARRRIDVLTSASPSPAGSHEPMSFPAGTHEPSSSPAGSHEPPSFPAGSRELIDAPAGTHELVDALAMAAGTALGVGALPEARRWGGRLAGHPLLAEAGHHATSWLLVADALTGDADEVLAGSVWFLDAWERSGRGRSFSLGPAAASVAMIHGLRGDHDARRTWLAIVDEAGAGPEHRRGYGAVFDATVLLHHGDADAALERVAPEPEQVWKWVCWIWLHWYVALRAEAAVLAGHPDARDRIASARIVTAGNPAPSRRPSPCSRCSRCGRSTATTRCSPPATTGRARTATTSGCPACPRRP